MVASLFILKRRGRAQCSSVQLSLREEIVSRTSGSGSVEDQDQDQDQDGLLQLGAVQGELPTLEIRKKSVGLAAKARQRHPRRKKVSVSISHLFVYSKDLSINDLQTFFNIHED